jgi:hypothetical protein
MGRLMIRALFVREAGRVRTTDWPLAAIAATTCAAIALRDGGYFPTEWASSSLVLFCIATTALLLRDRFAFGRLDLVMLALLTAFVAWLALSAIWSTSVERTVLELQRGLVYLAGLLTVFLVARGRSTRELLFAVCGASLLVSAVALTKLFFPDRFSAPTGVFYRLSEPLGYPNALALVAVIGALLATAFAAHARSGVTRAFAAGSLVVFAFTLLFTFSRGAWICLAVGLMAMFALDSRRIAVVRALIAIVPVASVAVWLGSRADALTTPDASSSRAAEQGHLLALAAVALFATAASAAVAVTFAARRISLGRRTSIAATGTILVLLFVTSAAAIGHYAARPALHAIYAPGALPGYPLGTQPDSSSALSLSGRIPVWRQAWRDWEAHPALGSGAGTFEQYWLEHRRTSVNVRDAHSLYLETLAELGPLGLGLLAATLGIPLLAVVRARSHPFVPAAFAAYVAYLIHAAGDWDWEMPAVTLLALCCGAALVLAVRPAERRTPPLRIRAPVVVGTLILSVVAFAGLIGNGALAASARAGSSHQWRRSASEARKAIRWMPWSSEARWRLALAQNGEGKLVAARVSLRRATAKNPREWRPWLGLVQLAGGQLQNRALKQAARLNPRDPEIVQFLLAPGSLITKWRYDDAWIGWPVAPVHRQHPIRSSFLDPRTGTLRSGGEAAYHTGIDITVRDDRPEPGAPAGRTHRVYAIEGGQALVPSRRSGSPCVNRRVTIGHFSYWHVDPDGVVTDGESIRPGQMIGWTCKGLWHVHLSESMDLSGGRGYVNPLHAGMKLRPYVDREAPRIHAIRFFHPAMPEWTAVERAFFAQAGSRFADTSTGRTLLFGRVDIRAWIDDPEPRAGSLADAPELLSPSPPYAISLEVIRESDGRPMLARTVFRSAAFLGTSRGTRAVPIAYHYAPGTHGPIPVALCLKLQPADCKGAYWFRLFARPTEAYWDTSRLANGNYRVRVKASDASGNPATATVRITIRNPTG